MSWVYAVSITIIDEESLPFRVPPLVIKVAAHRQGGRRLAREAEWYDALRCMQGISLARCYGYFRREVDRRSQVVEPWDPACKFTRTEEDFDIFDLPHPSASLNVLLLERLGCRMTAVHSKEAWRRVSGTQWTSPVTSPDLL
ncbi:hypothetical protein BV20DRAFT_1122014 [Pilatotrama ljubarskyi]|nr:hypothetical protein BV20DRAFT_1122014 [Pilatotrama ljubarskyi]